MKIYIIPKRWHYAKFFWGRFGGWHYDKKHFHISFMFGKDCWWFPPRNDDDYDLNKLYGLSFGLFSIHKNSIRLAWAPDFMEEGKIKIFGYVYDKGVRTSQYIATVNVDATYLANIDVVSTKYKITVNGNTIEMDNALQGSYFQKEVYPYVGGNNTAIREMTIVVGLNAY